MERRALFAIVTALMSACGGSPADTDAGPGDAGPGVIDAGPGTVDAGPPRTDAGPECVSGCAYVELALGTLHACGRRENREVRCWGRNQELQLGDGRSRHQDCAATGAEPADCSSVPQPVRRDDGVGRPVVMDADALSAEGFSQACVLRAGELWCWGEETVVMAGGSADQRPVAVRDAETVTTSISTASVGSGHLCVVTGPQNAVVCAGRNSSGQLGNGDLVGPVVAFGPVLTGRSPDLSLPNVLQLESSFSTTCARTATDVFCWGRNEERQLGTDTAYGNCDMTLSRQVDCSPLAVRVGTDATPLGAVDDIDVGGAHVCAVMPDETVRCWGDNAAGQSGQTTLDHVTLPTEVAGVTGATQVAAGGNFSCALLSTGAVTCWGFNDHGQLGDGMIDHGQTCMVNVNGTDLNEDCSPSPVMVAGIDDATYVAANASYACAIRGDGSIWCWGNNTNRQCGIDDRADQFSPVMVQGTNGG